MLSLQNGRLFCAFRRAKARGTCGTRHAEERAREKTRLSKPRVSRALHAHLAFASACLKNAKKIGLVLQASVYRAKNDCNACGFERNNKYHVNQEFNVLF